jgi:hypothetical protein
MWRASCCLVTFAVSLVITTEAVSAWKIESSKDRMTDQTVSVASVAAKESSGGVRAELVLQCLHDKLVGGRLLTVFLSQKFTQGRIGFSFRVDSRALQQRIGAVGTALNTIFVGNARNVLSGDSHRFRLQIFPAGSSVLFYDFDISGVKDAFKAVACVEHQP